MNERERIALFARTLGVPTANVEVGIGDDAAVLRPGGIATAWVWTIDEQVEGTHFTRDWVSWRDVGWRSFMAAASDVAAMGAEPWCALAAIVLSSDVDDEACVQIASGQRDAAAAVGASVVGGNLAKGPVVSIATTLLGTCMRAVQRRGARAGDTLWLAGRVGLAAAGLRALQQGRGADSSFTEAVEAWQRPRALIEAGRALGAAANAAIDVSDGLAGDAGHIGDASSVALVLDESALLADSALVRVATALGENPLDLALYGGEDYALVAASPRPIPGFRQIGEVRKGRGLLLRTTQSERPLEARGFDHFRTGTSPGV